MQNFRKTLTEYQPKINYRLLPIKLHYVLFWCGIGSSLFFVPLIAKRVGIHASAVGIIYTIVSLTNLITQPGFGAISDRFQNAKNVVMVIVGITGITLYALLYIPTIQNTAVENQITLDCVKDNFNVPQLISHNVTCATFILEKGKMCNDILQQNRNASDEKQAHSFRRDTGKKINYLLSESNSMNYYFNCSSLHWQNCMKHELNITLHNSSYLWTCFPANNHREVNIYQTYQLWVFCILVIISHTMTYTCFSLSDAICYELLGEELKKFGQQRLWSSCSFGIASFLAGYFNDVVSTAQTLPDYSIGFYITLGTFFMDLVVLYKLPFTKVPLSKFSLKHISQVLVSFEIIVFTVGVFFVGTLTSLVWNYQFWFLETIGASQTLLGTTVLFQCLFANVLFFFISGRILHTLGHFYCLIVTFLAFVIRYIFYFILKDPWHMLPVEILDGVTFSLFYVNLTSFAKIKAPRGMEATMVGLLVSIFEGLGVAVGSLLTGLGFDYLGVRYTFLAGAIVGVICIVSFLVIKFLKNMNGT